MLLNHNTEVRLDENQWRWFNEYIRRKDVDRAGYLRGYPEVLIFMIDDIVRLEGKSEAVDWALYELSMWCGMNWIPKPKERILIPRYDDEARYDEHGDWVQWMDVKELVGQILDGMYDKEWLRKEMGIK